MNRSALAFTRRARGNAFVLKDRTWGNDQSPVIFLSFRGVRMDRNAQASADQTGASRLPLQNPTSSSDRGLAAPHASESREKPTIRSTNSLDLDIRGDSEKGKKGGRGKESEKAATTRHAAGASELNVSLSKGGNAFLPQNLALDNNQSPNVSYSSRGDVGRSTEQKNKKAKTTAASTPTTGTSESNVSHSQPPKKSKKSKKKQASKTLDDTYDDCEVWSSHDIRELLGLPPGMPWDPYGWDDD